MLCAYRRRMKKYLCALVIGVSILLLGVQAANSAQQTPTVQMKDFSFKPDALTVHAGDTVVFENDDDVTHNVTGDSLKSGDIGAGKSWKYTFSKAGTYSYVCTYHPGMQGTIKVTAASGQ